MRASIAVLLACLAVASAVGHCEFWKNTETSQFSFHFKGGNGEIVGFSETYKQKEGLDKGITSVITWAKAFDKKNLKSFECNANHHLTIKAPNKEVIAQGEKYSSKAACEKGLEALVRIAKEVGAVDKCKKIDQPAASATTTPAGQTTKAAGTAATAAAQKQKPAGAKFRAQVLARLSHIISSAAELEEMINQ